MTLKQTKILEAALELFTSEGYHATSTYKIAKYAGVSEGLIFRHFHNKEGLAKAIIKDTSIKINKHLDSITKEDDPKLVLIETLNLPFNLNSSEIQNWNLFFKLKWELPDNNPITMELIKKTLIKAFTKLRYKHPEHEANLVLNILEGILSSILQGQDEDQNAFNTFLLNKYGLI
ncbi:MAG: TetR/AcrR family transcriptional regulator [Bacteroidia bacterium]|nr:TetR/AcrR family transcriptional regulator [Bacteroidia bacterium]NND11636.1 helix-turn-helix transcriptional regulator [Flavobacteriaceae bacterium]MBT8309619.1 TetR/AcrR family transcriptional regulator [Bacteroidia bacterium]NNK27598.1 helix-turn-helix transcriptional regulator [Flavobacteriaceae bacterium]NNL59742.1 helix-turn-helix transcriptional regulator [Flavobacteriaceae bacterium]